MIILPQHFLIMWLYDRWPWFFVVTARKHRSTARKHRSTARKHGLRHANTGHGTQTCGHRHTSAIIKQRWDSDCIQGCLVQLSLINCGWRVGFKTPEAKMSINSMKKKSIISSWAKIGCSVCVRYRLAPQRARKQSDISMNSTVWAQQSPTWHEQLPNWSNICWTPYCSTYSSI